MKPTIPHISRGRAPIEWFYGAPGMLAVQANFARTFRGEAERRATDGAIDGATDGAERTAGPTAEPTALRPLHVRGPTKRSP
jgi:hypothetical protein